MNRKEALEAAKTCVLESWLVNSEKREVLDELNKAIEETKKKITQPKHLGCCNRLSD